jgi:hypothetical protein
MAQGDEGVYTIPVVKGGGVVSINITDMPDQSYRGIVASGLKIAINSGATKITQDTDAEGKKYYTEENKKAALELARKKVEQLMTGDFKFGRGSTADKGLPHKLVVLATQKARDAIRQLIKDSGGKVTHYKASDITAAAKALLADEEKGKYFYDEAQAELDKQSKVNLSGFTLGIHEDPEKVKKAKEKTKLDVGQLSAAAASRTSTSKAALKTAH